MTWQNVLDEIKKAAGKKLVGVLVKAIKLPGVVGNVAGELIFPDAAGVPDSEIDWNKAGRERLINDALDAVKKLPIDKPTYPKGKPVLVIPKDIPVKPTKPVTQPSFKLPEIPNGLPTIDPFLVPKELVKRVRAISGKSATKRTYGRMECHPISYEKDVVFNVVHDVIGTGQRNENSLKGAENFMKWLVRENGNLSTRMIEDSMLEGGGILTGDIFWDQVAYIEPHTPGNWTGPMGFKFGAASIADEAADYEATRQNAALGGIKPVIYWNKPSIVVKPSGDVDLSQRFSNEDLSSSWDGLASKIKEVVEYYGERKIRQLDIVNQSSGEIAKKLGVDQFPFFIPRSLCNHEKEDLVKFAKEEIAILKEKLAVTKDGLEKRRIEADIEYKEGELGEIESGYVKINEVKTHAELFSNSIELFSELLGAWPIKIDIEPGHILTQTLGPKDPSVLLTPEILEKSDPKDLFEIRTLKDPIKLRFPNIGELLSEMELQILNMQGIQNLQQEFFTRFAAQMCSMQQLNLVTNNEVTLIKDWIGMKTVTHDDYVTLAFDPMICGDPENDEFYKYLIGKNVPYKKEVFAIDKDNQTLTASQFIYANACTIVKNALYRKFDGKPGSPMENPKSFLKSAKEMLDLWNGLDGVLNSDGTKTVSISFDELKEMYIDGFAPYTKNPTDDPDPWGDDKDERPLFNDDRVVQVGDKLYGKTRD
jgi:hypothetical protein